MSTSVKSLSLLLLPAALACSASGGPGSKSPEEEASPALCNSVGPMLDLRSELLTPVPASGNAAKLALYDARLAALRSAERRLGDSAASPELVTLRKRASTLASELLQERKGARSLAQAISGSHLTVNAALAEASTCQGFDLRLEGSRKAKAAAESRRCEGTLRIAEAVRHLDVDSRLDSDNMGRHLAELSMKGSVAAARDKLSRSLISHAKHLAAFEEHTNSGARASQLNARIGALAEALDSVGARCLSAADDDASGVVAGTESPRRITVLVRPTWEDQEGKSQDTGSFGSGVLVRWRLPSGETEVRVVSNAHVLGGAQQADIIAADELDNKPKNRKVDKTWRAHVLRVSEDDDLAVLRLDNDAAAPESGVTLRFSPPDEQETVVAAGFPGVGSRPSFQISQGTISNRKFAINEGAFGVYLQHTSPIDPGNSGGPLLDSDGRLLGLNTIKIRGRDSVGLAIPTARVLLALERADDVRTFLPEHAAALCQSLVGELASEAPSGAIVEHMSLSLTAPGSQMADRSVTAARAAVSGEGDGPDWQARLTAFARLRARVDTEGGVPKLAVCSEPTKLAQKGSFELTFPSATATHKLQLANEGGVLRLVWVD